MCDLSVSSGEVSSCPHLVKWFSTKMQSDPAIQKLDKDMKDALNKLKKTVLA